MSTEQVINHDPTIVKDVAKDLASKTSDFRVVIEVSSRGLDVQVSGDANFYAVIGAVESARALLRLAVIDGWEGRVNQSPAVATEVGDVPNER